MSKVWKILPRKSDDLITQLLFNRGIKTPQQRQEFFNANISDYEAMFKIPGISKAKKRILEAVKNEELIVAYGDYDVDGVCGAAILYLGLTQIGAKVLPYIPHREKEGYGLSKIGLDWAKSSGAKLVITVDCGIVSFEEAKYAKKIGLELIITDHHQTLDGQKPDCFSVIHSTQICGTVVAWCLIKNLISGEKAEQLLDLVAIATISDVMPLLGLNRALVKSGLLKLNKTNRVGLLALFNEAGIKPGNIGSYEIGHIIAPRLNAMGRLEHAIDSLRLLCTRDPLKAIKIAQLVGETNNQRKKMTLEAIEDAKLQLISENKIHVVSDKSWVPGIIGLVAGRICDETRRPAVAISVGPLESKGSARSVDGVNIVEVIRQCSDILLAVGGHPGAAGFTIQTVHIEEFQKRLLKIMDENLPILYDPTLEIEAEAPKNYLTLDNAKKILEFDPFGSLNPRPILVTLGMRITDLKVVGGGKHLKGKADGVDFIAFGMGDLKNIIPEGLVDLAYNLEIDKFNGLEKVQLMVQDLKIS